MEEGKPEAEGIPIAGSGGKGGNDKKSEQGEDAGGQKFRRSEMRMWLRSWVQQVVETIKQLMP